MDIQYLLWLQDFRISINDAWTPFMEAVSLFATTYIYLLPAFVYWCIRKRDGLYIIASLGMSNALNSVVKLTACVYRPWIRDARIIPAGNAIATAGGYSFPSGHTMTATPIYGGLAVVSRKKLARAIWVALILVTGFSRNYLGVHTPQDVVVGMLLSTLCLYVAAKVFSYVNAHREKENMFLVLGFLVGVAALAYISLKSYPTDYVDGKLLVNPDAMRRSGFDKISAIFGLVVGRYVERRWVKFEPAGFGAMSIIMCAVGLAIYAVIIESLKSYLVGMMGVLPGRAAYGFLDMFYVVALWPAVMKVFRRNK